MSQATTGTGKFYDTYPAALKDAEAAKLRQRRKLALVGGPGGDGGGRGGGDGRDPVDDAVGVGLSGGGIRSATQCLGAFQAMAKHGLLKHIDFISTVSGGGYFGGFLGRLYTRGNEGENYTDHVRGKLDNRSPELRYLRDNGNYIAPNGSGDAMMAIAIILRNWLSIMAVMATAGLVLFLGLRAAWLPIASLIPSLRPTYLYWGVAWSAYFAIPAFLLLFFCVPLGWAYWFVPTKGRMNQHAWWRGAHLWSWLAAVVIFAAAATGLFRSAGDEAAATQTWAALAVVAIVVMAFLLWIAAIVRARIALADGQLHVGEWEAAQRNRLSDFLGRMLSFTIAVILLLLIDTLGLHLYNSIATGNWGWATTLAAALAGGVAFSRKAATLLAGKADESKTGRSFKAPLATIAALALAAGLLGFVSAAAHAIAWGADPPCDPATLTAVALKQHLTQRCGAVLAALLLVALVTACWSRAWTFVNRSSYHPFYTARLTRAYLGASNAQRRFADGANVTKVHRDDNTAWPAYHPEARGGPLHLVNVTINETVEGRSQLQQMHRRGLPMTLGPAGLSVAARHHAVYDEPNQQYVPDYDSPTGYKVFQCGQPFQPERLSLGQWIAISGAAFTTGVGYRTRLGTSMLAAMFNVRLGYWWDSDQPARKASRGFGNHVQWAFISEATARFPGTARRHWYLSDGGHFENLGGYELIRRRLPFIILLDNEQDAGYTFNGLSNLVLKARLDFNAEIVFPSGGDWQRVAAQVHPDLRPLFGELSELKENAKKRGTGDDSMARATIGFVHYRNRSHPNGSSAAGSDERPNGIILYIKPIVRGDEPADVLYYKSAHPDFPHETTADQFFDEHQWESYRKLGEHTVGELFIEPDSHLLKWSPRLHLGDPAGGTALLLRPDEEPEPAPARKKAAKKKRKTKATTKKRTARRRRQ